MKSFFISSFFLATFLPVVLSQTSCPNNIVLSTQAQVDNFAINYPGCTSIRKLVLNGGISNIDNLSNLTTIDTFYILWNENQTPNFFGLSNVTYISHLASILDDYEESGWDGTAANFNGLSNVQKIGSVHLGDYFYGGMGFGGLSRLKEIEGSISYSGMGSANLGGLDSLEIIGGSVTSNWDAPSGLLPRLRKVGGSLWINTSNSLQNLDTIGGSLEIEYTATNSMPILGNLKFVGSYIILKGGANISSVQLLPTLTHVGSITIDDFDVDTLKGFNSLNRINGSLSISGNANHLQALNNIDTISGTLSIVDIYPSSDISFDSLKYLGSLHVVNNYPLSNLTFGSLSSLNPPVTILGNENLNVCIPLICDYVNSGGSYNISNNLCDGLGIEFECTPPQKWFLDSDNDGFGNPNNFVYSVYQYGPMYTLDSTDCDDDDSGIFPNAEELCNGIDDSCNDEIDEGLPLSTYFLDADNDGFGNINQPITACILPPNCSDNCSDCDDYDLTVHPDKLEIANGIDDDCNNIIDDVCGNVTVAVTVNTSPTSLVLDWEDMNDAQNYNLQWRKVGTLNWGPTPPVSSSNSFAILSVDANSNYEYRIRTRCNNLFTPYSQARPFSSNLPQVTCTRPIVGSNNPISSYTIKIWWNATPQATKYSLRYRKLGTSNWVTKQLVGANPFTNISGLSANTTYVYQIRALCPPGNLSNWTNYSVVDTFTMPSMSCEIAQNYTATFSDIEISQGLKCVSISPNPTQGELKVNAELSELKAALLYDTSGRLLKEWRNIQNDDILSFTDLSNGVYILQLQLTNGISTHKVIKM